jgi:hypothetical protein
MTNTNINIKIVKQGEVTEFLNADFCEKINHDESHWTIEENKNLVLYLDKLQERIWKSAFIGHKEIDTKKVDNSKRIDEFDNDTQVSQKIKLGRFK